MMPRIRNPPLPSSPSSRPLFVLLLLLSTILLSDNRSMSASADAAADEIERELRALASLPSPKTGSGYAGVDGAAAGAAAAAAAAAAHLQGGDFAGVGGGGAASSATMAQTSQQQQQQQQRRRQHPPPPPPCQDLNPTCSHWTTLGECTTSPDYMQSNCPLSCHLCDAADGGVGVTPLSVPYVRVGRRRDGGGGGVDGLHVPSPGVPQRCKFPTMGINTQSPIPTDHRSYVPGEERTGREDGSFEMHWDAGRIERRVLGIMDAMDLYLRRMDKLEDRGLQRQSKQQMQLEALIPELCLNLHPNCAFWAVRGYCDTARLHMKETCPAVCHVCPTYQPGLAKRGKTSDIRRLTAVERFDLMGVFEALQEGRVEPPARLELLRREGDGDGDGGGDGSQRAAHDEALAKETEEEASDRAEGRIASLNEDYDVEDVTVDTTIISRPNRFSTLVQFENFISEVECKELRNLIRTEAKEWSKLTGEGVGSKVGQIGKDGFPAPTFDKLGVFPESRGERLSARTYVGPQKLPDGSGSTDLSPILERLLTKIELVTGIPASDRVEYPIRVEKFEKGHFQESSLHFGTALDTPEPARRGALSHEEDLLLTYDYGLPAKRTASSAPRTMHNPRIFGFTIVLSDVPRRGGGEIVFPKVDNATILPEAGTAILFPTVLSLIGEEEVTERQKGDDAMVWHKLDEAYRGGDGSFLEEDFHSEMKHSDVTNGVKYVMQLYFRRYPWRKDGVEEREMWVRKT